MEFVSEPTIIQEARNHPYPVESEEWRDTIKKEFNGLIMQGVITLHLNQKEQVKIRECPIGSTFVKRRGIRVYGERNKRNIILWYDNNDCSLQKRS